MELKQISIKQLNIIQLRFKMKIINIEQPNNTTTKDSLTDIKSEVVFNHLVKDKENNKFKFFDYILNKTYTNNYKYFYDEWITGWCQNDEAHHDLVLAFEKDCVTTQQQIEKTWELDELTLDEMRAYIEKHISQSELDKSFEEYFIWSFTDYQDEKNKMELL